MQGRNTIDPCTNNLLFLSNFSNNHLFLCYRRCHLRRRRCRHGRRCFAPFHVPGTLATLATNAAPSFPSIRRTHIHFQFLKVFFHRRHRHRRSRHRPSPIDQIESLFPEDDDLLADVPEPAASGQPDQRNIVLVEMISQFGAARLAGDADEDDEFAAESDYGVVVLVRSGRRPRHQQRLAIRETVNRVHRLDQLHLMVGRRGGRKVGEGITF